MMQKFKNLFTPRKQDKKNFSSFFRHSSPEEQKQLMEELARKANKDQRELVEQYHKTHQKPA